MKKYILYILVGIASWGLASCNGFLDVDQYFNDLYQLDSVFHQTKYDRTMVVESVFPSGC